MEFSKDDMLFILQRYDDRYRDNLNKTNLFIDKIFDTYHREKYQPERLNPEDAKVFKGRLYDEIMEDTCKNGVRICDSPNNANK